jgi:hypothetical protein
MKHALGRAASQAIKKAMPTICRHGYQIGSLCGLKDGFDHRTLHKLDVERFARLVQNPWRRVTNVKRVDVRLKRVEQNIQCVECASR